MLMTDGRFALLLMLPAAAFLGVFVAWPLGRLVLDSLYEISPLAGTREFVGLDNYREALTSADFTGAALRTAIYTVFVVSMEFVLGLATALLFHTLGQRSRLLRTAFLYPLMIAPIVAGLLWRFMLIDNFGIVNEILSRIGVIGSPDDIGWLSDPDIVLFSVALPDIWLTTSFMSLILFAGLQNIAPDILEAARLDGAGPVQMLMRIILPLLRPVIAVALVVRGIDAVRAFDVILIQTDGGPQSASETLSLLIYRTMVRFGEPGLASAMGTLYLLAMFVLAAVALATIWNPGKESA
ncbi:sugar ABC transporter permease [Frankia sp. EAN1pec]|uniref:ABC transporter permease subunit n=1 Tax=Parafrankia sp. (strain EAN1pec) TaxID=298653 RepID=UPI00059CCA3D